MIVLYGLCVYGLRVISFSSGIRVGVLMCWCIGVLVCWCVCVIYTFVVHREKNECRATIALLNCFSNVVRLSFIFFYQDSFDVYSPAAAQNSCCSVPPPVCLWPSGSKCRPTWTRSCLDKCCWRCCVVVLWRWSLQALG